MPSLLRWKKQKREFGPKGLDDGKGEWRDRPNYQSTHGELGVVLERCGRLPAAGMLHDREALAPEEKPCGAARAQRARGEPKFCEPELVDDSKEHGPECGLRQEDAVLTWH